MILIGVFCMLFFFHSLLSQSTIGSVPLFWLLISTFIYTCFKILYEWYHYWDISVSKAPKTGEIYTVDIFTTFCAGEPYEMIQETLSAVLAIRYPHKTYLCDEADDPFLKEWCKANGVYHITRSTKENAKAGNINNALKQSSGELCVVLDPDHVPLPEFLDQIVDHFNNPEIGFVQIVQAYYNHHQSLIAKGAAQQTYQFYGPMMMTMNSYGTVQAIGANCTFRRTALESIGGHAAGLAEDMHTAMQLHAKGWKSVYVPAVLAKGLVPATLSAYYKQQLKWSRGVFELLVTSYLKLFRQFNWRQKLHYGLIPGFYLSGLVFLINFLIPIVSLLGDIYPVQINFSAFSIISLPLITSIVLIRLYVQRWVLEDDERGVHVVGGLLLIGTWWIFLTGMIYTIIRKKVPYIPTPKDLNAENNLKINLPNIFVFILSLIAIGYGLYNNLNPFSFIMAGIAGLNCFFMMFMFVAGEELKWQKYQFRYKLIHFLLNYLHNAKKQFWLFRRRVYAGIRNIALMLIVLVVCFSFYLIWYPLKTESGRQNSFQKKDLFLSGIFAPSEDKGLSSLSLIRNLESGNASHFDIISFYIPWGNEPGCFLPSASIDSVYQSHSLPMITWEPWQALFEKNGISEKYVDKNVFSHILEGKYDRYIHDFAFQMRALNRPVFLRFAHEADNPFYPWSPRGGNTASDFKAAWQYIYQIFRENHAYNVIWVWNPWKPDAVESYFPGKEYVDWIGVTGLNFGAYSPDYKSYSFEQLYLPFHRKKLFRSGLPVMVTEMGSLKAEESSGNWLEAGFKKIRLFFPEIRGYVLFHSGLDKNIPDGSKGFLDWRTSFTPETISVIERKRSKISGSVFSLSAEHLKKNQPVLPDSNKMFLSLRGVNYIKGQYWYNNIQPLTRRILSEDFLAMKAAGINTIKLVGPGTFDRLTLDVAEKQSLNIHYSFWIPDEIDFAQDQGEAKQLAEKILNAVERNKNHKHIIAWNISNLFLQNLSRKFYKPELLYQQQAYLQWLRQLLGSVKAIDPGRMITADVEVSDTLEETAQMMRDFVPQIDSFGLILTGKPKEYALIKSLKVPYFISSTSAELYLKNFRSNIGTFIKDWQDVQTGNLVTFDGLKDVWGRNKSGLLQISKYWKGKTKGSYLPAVKILRPAFATEAGKTLPYHALVYAYDKWNFAGYMKTGLKFEWYLVKTDGYGNGISMKKLGDGADIMITMPQNANIYKLYLIGSEGQSITIAQSILNIPFY